MRSTISDCSRSGMPNVAAMNFDRFRFHAEHCEELPGAEFRNLTALKTQKRFRRDPGLLGHVLLLQPKFPPR